MRLGFVVDVALRHRPRDHLVAHDHAADAPGDRRVLVRSSKRHRSRPRSSRLGDAWILCGGPWRSSTAFSTSSTSGCTPTALATESVTRVLRSASPFGPSVA